MAPYASGHDTPSQPPSPRGPAEPALSKTRLGESAAKGLARAKIDLEINLIAEREITKVIEMLTELQEHLGIKKDDHELDAMLESTRVEQLADTMEAVEASDK